MIKVFSRQGLITGALANFKGLFFRVSQVGDDVLVQPMNFGQPVGPFHLNDAKGELEEAVPLVVYFSLSTGEFISARDQSTRTSRDEFMTLHNSAQFAFSLTAYDGDYIFTFGVPVLPALTAEVKEVDPGMSTLRVLGMELPGFNDHPAVILRRERYKVLYGINTTESLSDLEKQVDVLTEVVAQLAQHIGVENKDVVQAALSRILENSSTRQLGFEACVDAAVSQKAKMRSTLAPYYKLKGKHA